MKWYNASRKATVIAAIFVAILTLVNPSPAPVAAASSIDLTVTSVNAPTTGQAGGYIAVSWTVKNQGSVASGTFYNRISLATTPYGVDISLGNFAMASISAGSSLSDAEVPQIPSSVSPGYYYVTVYADSFVQITEYNESNNIQKATYQIYVSPAVAVPTAPTLTDVIGTSNNVILAWTDNSNNEDGFKIERKEGTSGTYTQVATTGANVYAYADTGLQFGKVYCYRVRAYNSAGNSGYSSEKCATTLSTPTLSYPANGATLNTNTVTLTWNCVTGANGYAIKVSKTSCGGGDVLDSASYSCQQQLSNLANGVYYWQVQAAATTYPGLSEYSACRYFTVAYNPIDSTPPTVSISYPSNGQTFTTSTITVSGTASDDKGLSKVEVKVGSGSWELASGTTSWSKSVTLSPGSNTVYAKATDTSGNPSSQASVTVTYNTPDTTPPTVSISYPSNGQTFTTSTITVSGTASDDKGLSKVEVKVGSGSWELASGTTSWSKSVTLSPGSNTIYAKATDTSGNPSSQASVTVTYNTPDTTPPTVSISYPSNGQTFTTSTITVSGTASDDKGLSKVEVKVGSGSWELASGTTSWSKSVTLSPGSNTIYAKATDTSGNPSSESLVTVTLEPEGTPYAPIPFGYSFRNRSAGSLSTEGKWAILVSTFDLTGVDPLIQALWVNYLDFGEGGNCYGMAASSLMEYRYPDYDLFLEYMGESHLFDLEGPTEYWDEEKNRSRWDASSDIFDKPTLKHAIEFQISQSGIPRGQTIVGTESVLDTLLTRFPDEMYVLAIYDQGSGHALVPFEIETVNLDQEYNIYVYDCNYPGATDRAVRILHSWYGWHWEYELWSGMVWSGPSWLGVAGDRSIDLTPAAVMYNNGERLRLQGIPYLFLEGEANLLLIDSESNVAGIVEGAVVEEILGVELIFPVGVVMGESPDRWQPAFRIVPDELSGDTELTYTVQGLSNPGEYSMAKLGDGYSFEIAASVGSGDETKITLADGWDSITVSGQADKYTLAANQVTGDSPISFVAHDISSSVLSVHKIGIDWHALAQEEPGITIEKDHNGDGQVDEIISTGIPRVPDNPSPSHNAVQVPLNQTLSWIGDDSGSSVTYNVYLGTDTMDLELVSERQTETSYVPVLEPNTIYYWCVVPVNDYNISSAGAVWVFATAESGQPFACFIATAAYGTPMAEEIQILREFRDGYLLTNPVGKSLVHFYYKVSPAIAEFITDHPSLKPIVRVGLLPAVAMSTLVVNTTLAEKMAILGFVVFVSVAVSIWATRRRRRGPQYTEGRITH